MPLNVNLASLSWGTRWRISERIPRQLLCAFLSPHLTNMSSPLQFPWLYCNNISWVAKFDVFTAIKIQVVVFWFVAPVSDVVGYWRFKRPCCLHLHPEDIGNMLLRNVDILPYHYTVSQPRRLWLEYSPLWKPQISSLI
jgi:hypothetical protein